MRRLFRGLFFILLAALPWSVLAASGQALIHELSGNVQVTLGKASAVPATKNLALPDGATITTAAASRAVLRFPDGMAVLVNENSSFTIQRYHYEEKSPSTMASVLQLVRGGVRVVTGLMSQRNPEAFRLGTYSATIGVRGTDFMVVVQNPTFASVLVNSISVAGTAGAPLSVGVGQFAAISAGAPASLVGASALPGIVSVQFAQMGALTIVPGAAVGAAAGGNIPAVLPGGGLGGVAGVAGAAAAGAAIAAGIAGGDSTPGTTGTSGTSGTTGTR